MPVVAINLGGAPTVKQAQAFEGRLNPVQGNPTGASSRALVMLGLPYIYVWGLQRDTGQLVEPVITLTLDGCVRPNLAGGGGVVKAREAWVPLTSVVLVPHVGGTLIPRFFFPGMKVRLSIVASGVQPGQVAPVDYILAASA
jgi:hypothetical protein